MKYRTLPKTGWQISEISFGCMSLGSDQRRNRKLLLEAVDLGINLFDTADLYQKGGNEKSVGNALKHLRQDLFLATKVGNQWRSDGSGWDWNPSKAYIMEAVGKSLKRLQTDYIDLYQLHGGTIDDPIDEIIEAFERLKQKGVIRAYGLSSIRPNTIREYVERSNMVSVMMQYSVLDRRPEETSLSLLQDNQIGVLVRGAVAKGLLLGKEAEEYIDYSAEQVSLAAHGLQKLAKNDRTASQLALRFALSAPAVFSVASGISNHSQLIENAEAGMAESLSVDEISSMRHLVPLNQYQQHR